MRSVARRAFGAFYLPHRVGVRMVSSSVRCCGALEKEATKEVISETDLSLSPGDKQVEERVARLADEICSLSLLESAELIDVLRDRLGIDPAASFAPVAGGGGGGAGGDDGGDEAAEEVAEKTHFDVVLKGFDAKSKIKVIKEVRAATGLGLKEAKDLVESAPAPIMKGIKKEEAEALIETLKGVGAEVDIE